MSKYTVYNKTRFFGFLWLKKNHGEFDTLENATDYVTDIIGTYEKCSNVSFTIIPGDWESDDVKTKVIPFKRG